MLCAAVFGVALSLVRESDPGCSLLQDVQDYETSPQHSAGLCKVAFWAEK